MSIGSCTATNVGWSVETIKLSAAAARAKGDVVRISTGTTVGGLGVPVDVAIADDTNVYGIAVALESAASGAVYEAAVKGTVVATVPSGNYTAGNGLDILNGALRDSTAAAEAAVGAVTQNDFGCIVVGGTSVTSITVTLFGEARTAQT